MAFKVKSLKQDLKVWREVFGNVSTKKLEALERLGQWDAKERERALTVEEFEEKRRAIDGFKKWPRLEEILWR